MTRTLRLWSARWLRQRLLCVKACLVSKEREYHRFDIEDIHDAILYIRGLEFEEKPNYDMIRGKFRNVLNHLHTNRKEEVPLDWKVIREKQRAEKRQRLCQSGFDTPVPGNLFATGFGERAFQNRKSEQKKPVANAGPSGKVEKKPIPSVMQPKQPKKEEESKVLANNHLRIDVRRHDVINNNLNEAELIKQITENFSVNVTNGPRGTELDCGVDQLKMVKKLFKQLIDNKLQRQVSNIEKRKSEFIE